MLTIPVGVKTALSIYKTVSYTDLYFFLKHLIYEIFYTIYNRAKTPKPSLTAAPDVGPAIMPARWQVIRGEDGENQVL